MPLTHPTSPTAAPTSSPRYNITEHLYLSGDTGDAPSSCFSDGEAFRITKQGQLLLLRDLTGCTTYSDTTGQVLHFNMTLVATDSGGLTATTNVAVVVVDANTKPSLADVSVSLGELASVGATVTTLVATDTDDDGLTYALMTTGTVPFALDATSGALTTTGALDFETVTSYTRTVAVTDDGKGNLQDTATVTVTVQDEDEAPTLEFDAVLTVPENTVNEYNISDTWVNRPSDKSKRFAATDQDTNDLGTLTYALWSPDDETTARFALTTITSPTTGQTEAILYYKGASYGTLDYESRSRFVRGHHHGPRPDPCPWPESRPASAWFRCGRKGSASAPSPSARVRVPVPVLVPPPTAHPPPRRLPRPPAIRYALCVNVTDTTALTASACVTVDVKDVNEPPTLPQFLVFNVSEADGEDTYLGAITATDPEGDEVELEVMNSADTFAYLSTATTSSADLFLEESVDYETMQSFDVVVRAKETLTSEGLVGNATVTILILDVNDLTISAVSFASGMQTGMDTSGANTVTIYGTDYGDVSVAAAVRATYANGDGVVYEATGCTVTTLNTEITCYAVTGVGSGHVWTIYVTSITGTVWSKTADASITTSYEAPAIASVAGADAMPTTGNLSVTLTGTNLGPAWGYSTNSSHTYGSGSTLLGDVASVYYAPTPADLTIAAKRYECLDARVTSPHIELMCTAEAGVGRKLYWMVVVGVKPHSHPVQRALESVALEAGSYATPAITNVTAGGPITTAGGDTVKVHGTNFGPSGTVVDHVRYGGVRGKYTATSCSIAVPHTMIACTSVPGVGAELSFWAVRHGLGPNSARAKRFPGPGTCPCPGPQPPPPPPQP